MTAIISVGLVGVALLFLVDFSCYLWLHHNEANRPIVAKRVHGHSQDSKQPMAATPRHALVEKA